MNRLVPPHLLPPTLWDASGSTIQLPPALSEHYVDLLEELNLLEMASTREPGDSPVGGLSQEDTDRHLAQAFDGSVARAQLALLDPCNHLPKLPDMLVKCLAGNDLCIVDSPSGAGAASLAFLCTIAELRASAVLPRQPLNILLLAGELSKPARAYCGEFVKRLQPALAEQGIFVTPEYQEWDVTNDVSNTQLIQRMNEHSRSRKTLVVVANFNGFLERDNKRKVAEPRLAELFRHSAVGAMGNGNAVIWIEPGQKKVTAPGGTFSWLTDLCQKSWRAFARVIPIDGSIHFSSSARFQHPLVADLTPRVNLTIMPINLGDKSGDETTG